MKAYCCLAIVFLLSLEKSMFIPFRGYRKSQLNFLVAAYFSYLREAFENILGN